MKQRHDDPQFKFRMPSEMKVRLEQAAKQHGRTLTSEILQRLEWTLDDHRFVLHGPDGPEPSMPEDYFEAVEETEKAIEAEQMVLNELLSGGVRPGFSPREMAGTVRFQERVVSRLKEKLETLRANFVEERIRQRMAQAEAEWDERYPEGTEPKGPFQEGMEEFDRLMSRYENEE